MQSPTRCSILQLLTVVCAAYFVVGILANVDRLQWYGPEDAASQFEIVQLAEVPKARQITLNADGTLLFVATMNFSDVSHVFAVELDRDQETGKLVAGQRHTLVETLFMPSGIAFDTASGSLYIAEINRIIRINNIEQKIRQGQVPVPPADVVQLVRLPEDIVHGWKYMAIVQEPGSDRRFLIFPIGVPCNICDNQEPFGTINAIELDGSVDNRWIVLARGVRNSVGMIENPNRPGELLFTDNGRDWLGDDQPCDELNVIPDIWPIIRSEAQAVNFGFPYCHGMDLPDPEYQLPDGMQCSEYEYQTPSWCLGSHVAGLGLDVYDTSTYDMFPPAMFANASKSILIAEHGSWNRNPPLGYRISMINMDDPSEQSYRFFLDGFKDPEDDSRDDSGTAVAIFGRPVDILVYPHDGGSLLISEDWGHKIYHVRSIHNNNMKRGANGDNGGPGGDSGTKDPAGHTSDGSRQERSVRLISSVVASVWFIIQFQFA